MEGLFIAHMVQALQQPSPTSGWTFKDETTACLWLPETCLCFAYRPPTPALYFDDTRPKGEAHTAFQRFLHGKVRGTLLKVEQLKLDRVVMLHFSGEQGFVDTAPVRLIFEITGRNCNMMVLSSGEGFAGKMLTVAREIPSDRNRYRSIRSGGMYQTPPPYQKLDPRNLKPEDLAQLSTVPLKKWQQHIDGLGQTLMQEWGYRMGMNLHTAPTDTALAYQTLQTLLKNPSISAGSLSQQAQQHSQDEHLSALRKSLAEPLIKRLKVVTEQLADVTKALDALNTATQERQWADVLMAYAKQVPVGATEVRLPNFYAEAEVSIPLDPSLSAMQNATKLYTRAGKRENVAERLLEREPALQAEHTRTQKALAALDTASLAELHALEKSLRSEQHSKPTVGLRYTVRGYEVLVGRNNTENDLLTHKVGKSMDYWFHVQGYTGSHVLVRSGNKELPVEVILQVAGLAAYHSKAKNSSHVAVDYTRVKHVWRPRKAAKGQVLYTQQKTVYVDPQKPSES